MCCKIVSSITSILLFKTAIKMSMFFYSKIILSYCNLVDEINYEELYKAYEKTLCSCILPLSRSPLNTGNLYKSYKSTAIPEFIVRY